MPPVRRYAAALARLAPMCLLACLSAGSRSGETSRADAPKVGPRRGTVIVVGGGSMGPEIYSAFIEAAGGPNALIVDVPTAGGAATYPQDAPSLRGWRQAGARNIVVLHTTDKKIADSDSFANILAKAGGVWFDGGRHYRLVDSYAGTKTERAFHAVLERGGVVGGSSAGASILGDFLVRGAPSNDNTIMDHPGYRKGFAFLRGTAIDQHVVARERLPDLADSIMPKYPSLLGLSEDEGTAWVIRGDTGTIVGRSKGFVYGGKENDPRKPFLTLHPGDRYDLAARRVMRRAGEGSAVSEAFVDELMRKYADPDAGGASVLIAQNGAVLVSKSYGIPDQPRYMPTTTVPAFALGGITAVFSSLCSQLPPPPPAPPRGTPAQSETPLQACVARRIASSVGMQKTTTTAEGEVRSSVDALYRFALGLEHPRTLVRDTSAASSGGSAPSIDTSLGWTRDTRGGVTRFGASARPDGKRAAFVRVPDQHAMVIVLTNDETADAMGIATRIVDRLGVSSP